MNNTHNDANNGVAGNIDWFSLLVLKEEFKHDIRGTVNREDEFEQLSHVD